MNYEALLERENQVKGEEYDNASVGRDYLDGSTDAAFGFPPSSGESQYLDGYFEQLRRMVQSGDVTIQVQYMMDANDEF